MSNHRAYLLETVLEHTTESIFLIDRDGVVILDINKLKDDLIGRPILSAVDRAHHKRLKTAIEDAFTYRRPITCEIKGKIGIEGKGWISCRISPILSGDESSQAIVFASDITERKASELTQKRKTDKKLKEAQVRTRAVENILTMCAKTKKISFKGEWLSIEDFLWKRYGYKVSHGLSPEAFEDSLLEVREFFEEND